MPAWEIEEWRAYYNRNPMEDPYWIGAQICAVIANANRAKGRAAKVEDFIPRVVVEGRRQTPEEMLAIFRAATMDLGGR